MKTSYAMIMAVRNAAEFIEESLVSVFEQSYSASEIYVVDEDSTDRTVEIVRSFGPRVKLLNNTSGGMASAMNMALELVVSDFVAFLDSDDLWLPTKSEKQISYLNQQPEIDVVCSAVLNFTKDSKEDAEFSSARQFAPSRLFTASTFRRDVFERYGKLDVNAGHFGWLYEWWSRADDGGIRYAMMDEVLLHRRIHKTNSWIRNKELADETVIDIVRRNIKRRAND